LRDIGEARIELARAASEPAAPATPTTATAVRVSGGRHTTVAAVAVALVAIAAASVAFVRLAAVSTPPATTRLSVLTPLGVTLTEEVPEIVISPDGRTILFAGTDSLGVSRLWLRPLSSTIARPLSGTEGAKLPFWSPDGREIAFFRAGMLHRMELDGGNAQPICPATSARGGAWSRRGVIVFAPAASGPLLQVPASGGETRPVTTLDTARAESAHRFPCFLPDGTHFLYVALPGRNELFDNRVGSLDDPRPGPVVVTSPSAASYVEPGWLVFNREGAVVAQRFDPRTRKASGPLSTIPELVDVRGNYSGSPMVTASRTGTLLQREPAIVQTRLDRVDRTGRVLSSFPLPDGRFATPRVAPDGRHVVMGYAKTGTYFGALWMADLERRTATRFTFDGLFDINPVWSQDGRWVLYGSDRSGGRQIHRKRADGSGGEDAIGRVPNLFNDPNTVSPDGSVLVYRSLSGGTSEDLWLLPLTQPHTPRPLIQTRYNELDADISPDGRWIAYRSDESGRFELYLQPFPTLDRKIRVTRDGTTPDANSGLTATRWRADGRELFFLGGDGTTVMSVPVELGPEPRLGEPRPLFRLPRGTTGVDVSRDGQTFVLTVGVDAMDRGVLHLAMDWARATRAR
jgi:Tol biopolymer transport system component